MEKLTCTKPLSRDLTDAETTVLDSLCALISGPGAAVVELRIVRDASGSRCSGTLTQEVDAADLQTVVDLDPNVRVLAKKLPAAPKPLGV